MRQQRQRQENQVEYERSSEGQGDGDEYQAEIPDRRQPRQQPDFYRRDERVSPAKASPLKAGSQYADTQANSSAAQAKYTGSQRKQPRGNVDEVFSDGSEGQEDDQQRLNEDGDEEAKYQQINEEDNEEEDEMARPMVEGAQHMVSER